MKYMFLYLVMALLAGATIPSQAGINAKLNVYTGSPVTASIVSFLAGTMTLIIFAVVTRSPIPALSSFSGAPWWIWIGGVLGAFYVASCVILANKVGAVSMLALILAGQLLTSLVLDHYGLLGYQVQPVTIMKIIGIILIIAGVVFIRMG
ncbi:MAG TPA: DMT family transporter [Spirochaetota bacterium]|nr:DMT family transporter [Spirochaetota bacterium]HPJ42177.1 DMT family transporter [Spirochaetota bacterium]HRX48048.1 DMT family transporter [Spirochaetota bacterium]